MAVTGRTSAARHGQAELLAEEFSLRRPNPVLAHFYATRSHTLSKNPSQRGIHLDRKAVTEARAVPKLLPECHLFEPLGLALSEKQVRLVSENTEKAKC